MKKFPLIVLLTVVALFGVLLACQQQTHTAAGDTTTRAGDSGGSVTDTLNRETVPPDVSNGNAAAGQTSTHAAVEVDQSDSLQDAIEQKARNAGVTDIACYSGRPSLADRVDLSRFNGWITFDDGPHPETTPCAVKMLTDARVSNATFFFLGYRILEYPELTRLVVDAGFEVGYHSMFHQNLATLSVNQIRSDIGRFRKALNRSLGAPYELRIGRPTFGGMTPGTVKRFRKLENSSGLSTARLDGRFIDSFVHPNVIAAFAAEGLQLLLWNVDFDDWSQPISVEYAGSVYSADKLQVWLVHEQPIDWPKVSRYDNRLVATLPTLLERFAELQHDAFAKKELTREIQERLAHLGYHPGPVDGVVGAKTIAAARAFREARGMLGEEVIDFGLLEALRGADKNIER